MRQKQDYPTALIEPPAVTIERQRMERCSNLFPGFGSQYNNLKTQLEDEAKEHIHAIERAIAERYHYERQMIIPDSMKMALRDKATIIYVQLMQDIHNELILKNGSDEDEFLSPRSTQDAL